MKTVLITGASSEIGLSIIKKLEKNYNLILIKHKTNIDLNKFSTNPQIFTCDLSKSEEIIKLLNKLQNTQIDILINAAAYDQNNNIENIKPFDFEYTLKVNLIAPFLLIQGLFKKESVGTIINIASTDGIDTFNEYNITYATSKSALIQLTKQLNLIYKNINCYALCPNYIKTETVMSMDPSFLQAELKRINQKELIEVESVTEKIQELIDNKNNNEIIIRME